MHENAAPAGYELAQDITFTIGENGEVETDTIVMVDELSETTSNQGKDTKNSKELPQTGEAANVLSLLGMMLMSMSVGIIVKRK